MNIKDRKTIRKYKKQPIPDELLYGLLDTAARTQTMGNLQLYSVVVTKDEEAKQNLSKAHFFQPMVTEAPVVLTVCADFRRTTDWCEARKATPGYCNMLSFMNAATDALLYTQTLSCLAEEVGLGVCFLGTTVYMPKMIISLLQLPPLVMPVATLTIGWPDEDPAQTDRLPMKSFVHEETYRPYTKALIDRFYTPKEELPENRHFVEVNGKETLAQVFTDIRYTKKDNEMMSQGFIDALYQQGFLNGCNSPYLPSSVVETRPEVLECDVVRFQNKKEKWVAFVGILNGMPYEIFTGLMDDEEGISLPKSVTRGCIVKFLDKDGQKRYDFQFKNKRGYKTTIEGLSEKFNPDYWDYAKLISGVLRYHMPIDHVIHLVNSLQLENDSINSWKNGVARVLRKYLTDGLEEENAES